MFPNVGKDKLKKLGMMWVHLSATKKHFFSKLESLQLLQNCVKKQTNIKKLAEIMDIFG